MEMEEPKAIENPYMGLDMTWVLRFSSPQQAPGLRSGWAWWGLRPSDSRTECLEAKVAADLSLSPAISWHPATLCELTVSWANVKPCKNRDTNVAGQRWKVLEFRCWVFQWEKKKKRAKKGYLWENSPLKTDMVEIFSRAQSSDLLTALDWVALYSSVLQSC